MFTFFFNGNRGEIVARIASPVRVMGIQSIAVSHEDGIHHNSA